MFRCFEMEQNETKQTGRNSHQLAVTTDIIIDTTNIINSKGRMLQKGLASAFVQPSHTADQSSLPLQRAVFGAHSQFRLY